MPLLYLSLAWVAGDLIGAALALPLWVLLIPLPIIVTGLLLLKARKVLIISGLCLLALFGGAIRYQASVPPLDNTQVQFYNGKGVVRIEGTITGSPEVQHSSTAFRFSAYKIITNVSENGIKGDILVRLPFYRELHYGEVLQLTGKLETPAQFNDFDYKNYLVNQGIYSIMNYPGVTSVGTDGAFSPLAWVYGLRDKLAESLSVCLPEPQGSLAQAILLGMRGNLPESLIQSFYTTGTTHLIAISGLNLTIVLGMVLTAAVWLFGRQNKLYIWLSVSFIWLYTLVTGMPATMVRSAMMGSTFLLAELFGRQRNALAALSLACAIMVAVEPRVLWDVSFQLSFLSMLGLVLISPYLIKLVSPKAQASHRTPISSLRNLVIVSFGTTLAAVLATWPISALDFHSFSLVSVPATFFSMPSFPAIMMTSLLTSVGGLLWQPLGILIGWIDWLFLSYFILIVQLFSAIPSSYIRDFVLQPWQAGLYYVILAVTLAGLKYRHHLLDFIKSLYSRLKSLLLALGQINLRPYIYWLVPLLFIANILIWFAFASLPDGKLHVVVLDVGQGESILLRTPEGQNILIDSGPDAMTACTRLGNYLPFWDRKIDMLILTQLQSDHISGSLELMRKYDVEKIAVSPAVSKSPLPQEICNAASLKNIAQLTLHEGQLLKIGQRIRVDVLNPPPDLFSGTSDDANNNSLVLRLACDNVSFLFTSDIGMEAESYLIEHQADLRSDFLKVAHHGSKGSSSQEFLAIVHPSVAAISAGAANRFGHPNPEALMRLTNQVRNDKIFVTSVNGNIEFITDGRKLWYRVEKIAE